jgi:hypothetical protein
LFPNKLLILKKKKKFKIKFTILIFEFNILLNILELISIDSNKKNGKILWNLLFKLNKKKIIF